MQTRTFTELEWATTTKSQAEDIVKELAKQAGEAEADFDRVLCEYDPTTRLFSIIYVKELFPFGLTCPFKHPELLDRIVAIGKDINQ
jgi:hypothetical protein